MFPFLKAFRCISLLLAMGGFSIPISAQSPLDSVQHLHPVEVRARRQLGRVENLLTSVQTLQAADLQKFHPQQAAEALKQFAGVNVKDYGGVGGMKTVSVRSLGAAHTAVSYDGILLSDAQNGQIDLSKVYLDQVKRMSLYNGQSPSIFQPARNFASAALLEMESYSLPDFDSLSPFQAGFSFGSFGLLSPSFAFRKKLNPRLGISAALRYDYVYGNYPFEVDLGGSTERLKRENSDVQSGNAEFNLNFLPSGKHRLDFKMVYYGSERGLPGAVIYYYKPSAQRLEDHAFFGVLKHTWQISPSVIQRNAVKYNFSYNRFQDPESLASLLVDDRYWQQEAYLSSVTQYLTPVKGLSLSGALDAAFGFLRSNEDGFATPWRTSLWFNMAAKYTHKYVEAMANGLASAFLDRVRTGPQPEDKFRISPFVSIAVFPLGKRSLSLRVYYKDIFRMPTFNDLYYSRVGNTWLRPEQASQIDAGITYVLPGQDRIWHWEISGDFYRNWVKDKIVAYPTTNLFIWSMMNVDKVEITGLDAVLRLGSRLGRSGLASRFGWDMQASYTFQYALDKTDPNGPTYNHQIAYTPVHSGSAQLSLAMPYVTLSYRAVFSGERYALNQNIPENLLAAYVEHSLGLDVRFQAWNTEWEIGLDWLNFTNERYDIVKNYPMPGSNYRVHLKCRF